MEGHGSNISEEQYPPAENVQSNAVRVTSQIVIEYRAAEMSASDLKVPSMATWKEDL